MYYIGKKMKELGCEVSYLVADFGQPGMEVRDGIRLMRTIQKYASKSENESLKEQLIRKSKKWSSKLVFAARFLFHRYDIMIVRSASGGFGKLRLWTKLIGVKLVYMAAHEIDCSGEYERGNGSAGGWYRYGLEGADLVIAQNSDQQEMLRNNYQIESNLLLSVYPVEEVEKTWDGPVLWVGRCEDWKRPEIFIELARQNPDTDFIMIAPPALNKADYQTKIEALCKNVPNVTYKGLVPFHKINEEFKEASLFVITSRFEGFPNTLIQATKNKIPVASIDIDPNNVIRSHGLGVITDGDIEAFYKKTGALINDMEEKKAAGLRAYKYAKSHHDINAVIPEMHSLLEDLVR